MSRCRDTDHPPSTSSWNGVAEAAGKAAPTDARFDRWLSRRLHEAYDSVLKEALPSDLERLVHALAQGSDEPQHGADELPPARAGWPRT